MLCEKNIITQMILLLVNPIAFKCIFHDISQRFGPKMAVLFLYTCLNANGLRRSLGGCLKSWHCLWPSVRTHWHITITVLDSIAIIRVLLNFVGKQIKIDRCLVMMELFAHNEAVKEKESRKIITAKLIATNSNILTQTYTFT